MTNAIWYLRSQGYIVHRDKHVCHFNTCLQSNQSQNWWTTNFAIISLEESLFLISVCSRKLRGLNLYDILWIGWIIQFLPMIQLIPFSNLMTNVVYVRESFFAKWKNQEMRFKIKSTWCMSLRNRLLWTFVTI